MANLLHDFRNLFSVKGRPHPERGMFGRQMYTRGNPLRDNLLIAQNPQYLPPPPPPPQVVVEPENPRMVPEGFLENVTSPRTHPSSTSMPIGYEDYLARWCGTTYNDNIMYSGSTGFMVVSDETKLDERPLKHFLMKKFKWIVDVTEVSNQRGRIPEVHITVSPTHHSELMIPSVEKVVREKLYEELIPLMTCMYEDIGKNKPRVIFSPTHSETILEHFE